MDTDRPTEPTANQARGGAEPAAKAEAQGAATKAAKPTAERGAPAAEHGQYGMVRQGSKEAAGLTEEQIRGIAPKP
ncbi:hypothetical protein [Pseudorhodoferax sp. Leaf274]|uniref:hypothetical protein n=1 Tax=Pseudorhodoferax sp. Leaf274 TaxID=1736318 RepID=UPI000702E85B|nr:hypothetical protein [Pseudorhodoferax sp. Leaf274]KQP38024.1 hypothetical protein ASF44_12470 [Pseudorhodoferax sp. Leaf274]